MGNLFLFGTLITPMQWRTLSSSSLLTLIVGVRTSFLSPYLYRKDSKQEEGIRKREVLSAMEGVYSKSRYMGK